jgi:hypothetical protein
MASIGETLLGAAGRADDLQAGVTGYDGSIWWGILGPAGIPGPIVTKLNAEIAAILRDPDAAKRLSAEAAEPVIESPDAFGKLIRDRHRKNGNVSRSSRACELNKPPQLHSGAHDGFQSHGRAARNGRYGAQAASHKQLAPNAMKWLNGDFPWENMKSLGEIGVLGMAVPQEYGGMDASVLDTVLVLEEISKACYATALAVLGEIGVQRGSSPITRPKL